MLTFIGCAKFLNIFINTIEFAEVGEGNLDIPAIMEAGLESGAQYFLVEQDEQYGRDPFECLKISAENLRKMDMVIGFKLEWETLAI